MLLSYNKSRDTFLENSFKINRIKYKFDNEYDAIETACSLLAGGPLVTKESEKKVIFRNCVVLYRCVSTD